MTKATAKAAKKLPPRLTPFELMLARSGLDQTELADKLGRTKSLMSHWRTTYKGYPPSQAWDDILKAFDKNGWKLTAEEVRSGGVA